MASPVSTGFTSPKRFTVTTDVELLQVPPVTLSVKVTIEPSHKVLIPEIVPATGVGKTVTGNVTTELPQLDIE